MIYDRIQPTDFLNSLIDCYWVVESNDRTPRKQKIIPDGFPEIIFHYRDQYRINISGEWHDQGNKLLAGQIRNHFQLENSGSTGMIGIKFKPAAVTRLFGLEMQNFTDKVVDLDTVIKEEFSQISKTLLSPTPYFEKIDLLNRFFENMNPEDSKKSRLVNRAIDLIFMENGMISISDLITDLKVSERKLERSFNKYIGLTPKFYSRIIRFNYIFSLVNEKNRSWSELAQYSGYFDQSHFINNFREFTGEEPSKYIFDDENLANFFLNRPEEK